MKWYILINVVTMTVRYIILGNYSYISGIIFSLFITSPCYGNSKALVSIKQVESFLIWIVAIHDIVIYCLISSWHQVLQLDNKVTQGECDNSSCQNSSDGCLYLILTFNVEGRYGLSKPIKFAQNVCNVPWWFTE